MSKTVVKLIVLTAIFLLAEMIQAIVLGIAGAQGISLLGGI